MNELTVNYHTHTKRCNHAVGDDREYVEAAIKNGYKILGFSDHSPMPFKTDHYSGFRMTLCQADDYFKSVSDLKSEYRNDIEIKIGVEAEYYPENFDDLVAFLSQYPLDYMILGQHAIDREEDGDFSGAPGTSEKRLQRYLDNLRDGVKTGRFAYIAHPDLLNFTGADDIYEKNVLPFLNEMKESDVIFEINRLGLADHRHYPSERFYSLCGKVGIKTVIGLDAHDPKVFFDKKSVNDCFDFAERFNLDVLTDFKV